MNKFFILVIISSIFTGCGNISSSSTTDKETKSEILRVSSDKVKNNSEGIMLYEGKPYTGKVQDNEMGYILVEEGVVKHFIMLHENGTEAIDMDVEEQRMLFKSENGEYMTKQEFLKRYPKFEKMSDSWNEVEQIN